MTTNIQLLANSINAAFSFIDKVDVYVEELKWTKGGLSDRTKHQAYIRLDFGGIQDFRYDITEECLYDTSIPVVIVFKMSNVKLPCEMHDHILYFLQDTLELSGSSLDTGRIFKEETGQDFKGQGFNLYRFEGDISIEQKLGRRCKSLQDLLDC